MIFGQYLLSAPHAAEEYWYRKPKVDELPELRAMSDVMWGWWNRDNPNIRNIRYFWMQQIANEDTLQLIASALKNAKKELRGWPGTTFDLNSKEGQALLGTILWAWEGY